MTSRGRRAWFVVVVLTLLVAGAMLYERSRAVRPWTVGEKKAFDSIVWKADVDGDSGDRWRMLPSLVTEHPLMGRTRTDVEALLGPPNSFMNGWRWGQPTYPLRWVKTRSILGDKRRTPLVVFYDCDVVVGYWSLAASDGRLPTDVADASRFHQWPIAEEDQEW